MTRIRFKEALDMVPDDLSDGAYWAMAHEIAGMDYGEGFAELAPRRRKQNSRRRDKSELMNRPKPAGLPFRCGTCGKDFATKGAKRTHRNRAHCKPVTVGQT